MFVMLQMAADACLSKAAGKRGLTLQVKVIKKTKEKE